MGNVKNKRLLSIVVGVLVIIVVAFAVVGLLLEDSLPGRLLRGTGIQTAAAEPSYASATVDGSIAEWDLANDFFSDRYRAGRTGNEVEAELYLRYDCYTGVMYALVYTAGDWPALVESNEAWFSVNSNANKVSFIDFAWVDQGYDGESGRAKGWEASFPIDPGTYEIWAHINVDDGGAQTAGTDPSGMSMLIDCGSTTAISLGNFGATTIEGRVHLRWETLSEIDNVGFNVYHSNSKEGPWTQLNETIISSNVAPGSTAGAAYEYIVEDVDLVTENFYLLEDVNASGLKTKHGPISP
jgi:hypothetical protein